MALFTTKNNLFFKGYEVLLREHLGGWLTPYDPMGDGEVQPI